MRVGTERGLTMDFMFKDLMGRVWMGELEGHQTLLANHVLPVFSY